MIIPNVKGYLKLWKWVGELEDKYAFHQITKQMTQFLCTTSGVITDYYPIP